MRAWQELVDLTSYSVGVHRLLRDTVPADAAVRRVQDQLARRDEAFADLLAGAVFEHGPSPYRPLFRAAGIELADAVRLVRENGLDAALGTLYEEGIRVTLDELRAGGVAFDNPLATKHFQTRSGGSRSGGTPVSLDLALNDYSAGYSALVHTAFGLWEAPMAIWFPTAPATTGLRILLTFAKLGVAVERWFSQTPHGLRRWGRQTVLTEATLAAARLSGRRLPRPELTPPDSADRVAHWLAEAKGRGRPAVLIPPVSAAVRVCLAAQELGLDISGTFLRLGGEPFTADRARVIAEAGCRACANYYMAELGGFVGVACPAPSELDEVHLLTDKLAVIQREKRLGPGRGIGVLAYTALHRLSPKVLINLESDDYGVLSERDCGCPIQRAGFTLHLHGIRSYEKVTSEGITFLGSDVITLVENVLPGSFGGAATDYQLVEQDHEGIPSVTILVHPRLGELDERSVLETALSYLRSRGRSQAMMADLWRSSGTLRVERREPYVTATGKLPVLHILDSGRDERPSGAVLPPAARRTDPTPG